jgi:hypothetical protein
MSHTNDIFRRSLLSMAFAMLRRRRGPYCATGPGD